MMKRIPLRDIFWLFLTTRLLLVLITYIAYILLTAAKYSNTPVNVTALFSSWNHWDAANYVRIAQYGYARVDLAFFPLFPLLIAAIGHVLGDWSYLLVGTLLSNGALFAMLCVVYSLASEVAGDEIARRTLLYVCIFPTAFFFFAAYNESLYLFFAAGTFLALYKQRWWLAGLLGLLAALTRSAGVLLVIPYLYQLWLQRDDLLASRRKLLLVTLPIVLIPIGTLLYALYCWITVGNPLEFISVQQHSGRHLNWPWAGIWQAISALVLFHPQAFGSANQAHLLLDLGATLGFVLLIALGWRRLPRSYSIWMGVLMLYFLLYPATEKPDILLSNQRFVLELFPAFITLAILGKQYPRLHHALLLLFPTLLAVLSIAFIMNRWVV
ncbi:MAG: hypothetical protein NVS2B12_00750 [Ktedonobacteraceae bacterium]